MNRILITGGSGFVGSHLCERLINDGNEVICLDNYFTGSKKNIDHLIGLEQKFALIKLDMVRGNSVVSRRQVVSSNKKYKLIADKIDISNDFFSADLCV